MEDYNDYIEFIEAAEADRHDATPHLDSEGTALAQEAEPGCLFDSYKEEAA